MLSRIRLISFALILALMCSLPASGTIAFVVSATPVGVSSGTATTTGIDTTGATLLIVYVATALHNASTLSTITDSKSNTWTALNNSAVASNNRQGAFFYSVPTSVGSSHTFSGSNSSSYITIFPSAWSGTAASSPFDQQNTGNVTSGTTLQPGSVTPGQANELVITGISFFQTGTITVPSGYTGDRTFTSGTFEGGATAYQIQTTATATNPTWTFPTGECAGNIATFKILAAGGSPVRHKVTQQ